MVVVCSEHHADCCYLRTFFAAQSDVLNKIIEQLIEALRHHQHRTIASSDTTTPHGVPQIVPVVTRWVRTWRLG